MFKLKGNVERYPGPNGWFYVRVPEKMMKKVGEVAPPPGRWKFIKIEVTLGETTWQTSLLPMGNGQYFIALKAEVRKKEQVELGDDVSLKFSPLLP